MPLIPSTVDSVDAEGNEIDRTARRDISDGCWWHVGEPDKGEFAGLLISLDLSVPVLPERRAGLSKASQIKKRPSIDDSPPSAGRGIVMGVMAMQSPAPLEMDMDGVHEIDSWKKDPAGEISESVSSMSPSHEVLDLWRFNGLILEAEESTDPDNSEEAE